MSYLRHRIKYFPKISAFLSLSPGSVFSAVKETVRAKCRGAPSGRRIFRLSASERHGCGEESEKNRRRAAERKARCTHPPDTAAKNAALPCPPPPEKRSALYHASLPPGREISGMHRSFRLRADKSVKAGFCAGIYTFETVCCYFVNGIFLRFM